MSINDLTEQAVRRAIEEFDRLGREDFLERYGFGRSTTHYIIWDGEPYDAKAIAGVAHQYLSSTSEVLKHFKSGERTVNRKLRELGFEVRPVRHIDQSPSNDKPSRRINWRRDEVILALDLYVEYEGSPPGKDSTVVKELSATLNRMESRLGRTRPSSFRNANGVYMKMMNFRRFDPEYAQAGRVGLARGSKLDEEVWTEFARRPANLRRAALVIRAELDEPPLPEEPDEGAEEGGVITALHRRRERDPKIARQRKQQAMRETGELRCEACSMTFSDRYGERGDGYIEVHHTLPIHLMKPGDKTWLKDLALVCANCHRMIHRRMPWLSMEELRAIVVEGV